MGLSNPDLGNAITPSEDTLLVPEQEMRQYLKRLNLWNSSDNNNTWDDDWGAAAGGSQVSLITPNGVKEFECAGDVYILD